MGAAHQQMGAFDEGRLEAPGGDEAQHVCAVIDDDGVAEIACRVRDCLDRMRKEKRARTQDDQTRPQLTHQRDCSLRINGVLVGIKGQRPHNEGKLGARGKLGRSPVAASVAVHLEHGVPWASQCQDDGGRGEMPRDRTEFGVTRTEERSRQSVGQLLDLDDVSCPLVFAPPQIAPLVIAIPAAEVRRQELGDRGTVDVF